MLNDRDEKYDDEESEYHFSDEELSDDVDSGSKQSNGRQGVDLKSNLLHRLSQSKRLLISAAVFATLVFIVFKMVSPTVTSAPATDIVPPPSAMTQKVTPSPIAPPVQVAAVAPVVASPIAPPAPTVATVSPPQSVPQVELPSGQVQPPTSQPVTPAPVASAEPPTSPASSMPASLIEAPAQMVNTMAQMPTVVPLQPPAPETPIAQQTMNVPGAANVDARLAAMAAENDRLMKAAEAQYAQKLADYQAQNKNLQDQLQSLNTKMAGMESQMNQLLQTLSRQTQAQPQPSAEPANANVEAAIAEPEPKVAFNVQAIIPGRAWLRSDSGDTITVAEGDEVKGVGRVTKIDPYDGIVQISMGSRTVSLSYGSGG